MIPRRAEHSTLSLASVLLSATLVASLAVGADAQVERRIESYDMGFLELAAPPFAGVEGRLRLDGEPREWGRHEYETAGEAPISFTDEEPDLGTYHESGPGLSRGALVASIRDMIAPDSWSNARNSIHFDGDRLFVVQTPEVHAAIETYLDRLARVCGRRVSVDVLLVPVGVAREEVERAGGASGRLDLDAFESILTRAGSEARWLSASGGEGARLGFEPAEVASHALDYEVSQTGVLPVVNVAIERLWSGPYGDVRVAPSPLSGSYLVDLRVGMAESVGEREERRTPTGDLELLTREGVEVSTQLVVDANSTMLVATVETSSTAADEGIGDAATPSSSGQDVAVLLRLRTTNVARVPEDRAVAGGVPALVDLGMFVAERRGEIDRRRYSDDRYFGYAGVLSEEESVTWVSRAVLEAAIGRGLRIAGLDPEGYVLGARSVVVPAAGAEPVRVVLDQLARETIRNVSVELVQGTVRGDVLFGDDAAAPSRTLAASAWDDISAAASARVSIRSAAGSAVSVVAARMQSYVSDVEQVSGGTGAVILQVGDILVRYTGSGVDVSLRADEIPGTDWAQLSLSARRAREPRLDVKRRVRIDQEVDVDASTGEPELEATGAEIELTLPEEDVDSWEHLATLTSGVPMLLGALPAGGAAGELRALVARVVRDLEDAAAGEGVDE